MTQHLHSTYVDGCYRCALSKDEVEESCRNFAEAEVGDQAYTWEVKGCGDFGEYRFETAGDPRDFYDTGRPIIRKRWELVEVVELP